MNTYNLQIDLQCPQCGAPAVLDETEVVIKCKFCRTGNIIQTHPYPCFFITPSVDELAHFSLIYVPYWRFKGLEFILGPGSPEFKVIDRSNIAVKAIGLPASLGLRSQTQKMKFVQKGVEGAFLPPAVSRNEILRQVVGAESRKVHIGEVLSLIFMPFYQDDDKVYDGLTGKILGWNPIFSPMDTDSAYTLTFTPTLCPSCGWDLEGKTDSLVLHCRNCTTFWLVHNNKLNQISAKFFGLTPSTDIMMPFWCFQIRFETLELENRADLNTLANASGMLLDDDKHHPVCFYIPAFKISPKLFLRIGRQTTLAQVEAKEKMQIPDIECHPADLPMDEGFQAVFPMLMDVSARKKEIWGLLVKEKIKLKSFKLVYMGFKKLGREYIQENLGFSLPVNSIRFGRKL